MAYTDDWDKDANEKEWFEDDKIKTIMKKTPKQLEVENRAFFAEVMMDIESIDNYLKEF